MGEHLLCSSAVEVIYTNSELVLVETMPYCHHFCNVIFVEDFCDKAQEHETFLAPQY